MDEIGFNWGAGTPYLYSGFKESALAAEFVTNEYRTDARVEIGDIIAAYYSINNYDESLYYGESINFAVFDSNGNLKHYIEDFDDNYSINYLENLFGLDLNDDQILASLPLDGHGDNDPPELIEDPLNIDVYIDYDSFDRNGIIRELYEPFILEAVKIWEEVITEGLPDVLAGDENGEYGEMPVSYIWDDVDPYLSNTNIDDIAITFSAFDYGDSNSDYFTIGDGLITEIRYEYDQYNGDLTQIGLPSQGRIRFGTNEYIYNNFDMTALAVHEIAHVLGFGVLWYNELGIPEDVPAPWNQHGLGDLVKDFGYDDYGDIIFGYVGENALEAYSDISGYIEQYIPVEIDFNDEYLVANGSNFYHWDYYDGPQDLMLPVLESSELSTVTIESLKDIGYDIIDFGESHTQLVNYISTALTIENDLTNALLVASELNEDQTNIQQII